MNEGKKWTIEKLEKLYHSPLLELIAQAHAIHKQYHKMGEIQICSLISIKTGGCPEDCKYCAQSSRYQTAVKAEPMMSTEAVIADAKKAIGRGASRICLGAAWRAPRDSKQFEDILMMIKEITALGAEVCCTLGMLTPEQARRLKEAGLHSYNHNLDTSASYYKNITTTRSYDDRLRALDLVQQSNLKLCCGGIIGMGESIQDRLQFLETLCNRTTPPDSVPINCLTVIPGTPFEDRPKVSIWELIRMVAVTRIAMPTSMVRLSAGRGDFSYEQQALCFMAGANSIHAGEKLLTVANHPVDRDAELFAVLGLRGLQACVKD